MSIPTKCPGCQASFDIPDNLAGKTIRCTSCKSQLTVPAAGAKTNPNPSARSAASALPGAKGPPSRSAADLLPKGKAVRRRDDDEDDDDEDDDDEDDDDDRPRGRNRGKRAPSGGGIPVPAIIAVVLVLVLGGAGVGAFFVFGKKKDETASTNTGSGSTTTPPGGSGEGPDPAAGGRGGGRGVGGRPGPGLEDGGDGAVPKPVAGPDGAGETPVAAGGWKRHQGEGFSVEFPESWTIQNKTEINPLNGGQSRVLAAVGPNNTSVFAVAVQDVPPAARNLSPKEAIRIELEQAEQQVAKLGDLVKFRVTRKQELELDGRPAGEVEISDGQKQMTMRMLVGDDQKSYVLCIGGAVGANQDAEKQRFLGSFKLGGSGPVAIAPMGGGGFGGAGPADTPGRGGRGGGFESPVPDGPPGPPGGRGSQPGFSGIQPPDGGGRGAPGRGSPDGGRGGLEPPGGFPMPGPAPGGQEPPGFPMPTQPPGGGFPPPGGGGPDMNPGGGFPVGGSAGGFTVPPIAGRLEPFFAIAFDTDKGEAYTLAARPMTGGKVGGTLRRYSYPGFVQKGQWKVPQLGTRMALDPVGGKLYVATATPTPQVAAQRLDRATGTGDVAVFDLAGVRGGKVEDGSDLKPAATIPVSAPIRGLDVSADGKTLTVLIARATGTKKSTLVQYATADRKETGRKDLPNPAWDMVRSGDGKSFLVIEYPPAAPGASAALVIADAATLALSVKSLPGGGMTSDVAASPDGKVVAAQGATQGQAGKLMVYDPQGGGAAQEIPVVPNRAHQNGYARFTPDGKKLLVTSHGYDQRYFAPGLDVYDVTDAATPGGYKKVASLRSAGQLFVGGNIHIAPDGTHVVFQTGVALAVDKLTENTGGPEPPGLNGGGFGGFGGGGGVPGAPEGGAFPGGLGAPGGPMGVPGAPMGQPGGFGMPPGGIGVPGGLPPGGRGGPPGGAGPGGAGPGGFGMPPGGFGMPPGGGFPGGLPIPGRGGPPGL
jgi:hypothetical protein